MNYSGWLRFYRKQWGNWVSEDKPFCKGYAWTYLYSEANWVNEIWAKENIEIKRGQFPTSVNKLSQDWGWSRGKVNTFLTRLKNDRMIDIEKTTRYIVVTIINYELYQLKEGEPDINLTQKRHKTEHTIRSKEVKNLKEVRYIVEFLNSTLNSSFRWQTEKTQKFIEARLNEKFLLNDFELVIVDRAREWRDDKGMKRFLRPETLFGTKMEGYLQEAKNNKKQSKEQIA